MEFWFPLSYSKSQRFGTPVRVDSELIRRFFFGGGGGVVGGPVEAIFVARLYAVACCGLQRYSMFVRRPSLIAQYAEKAQRCGFDR